jgi:biotin operon repressor
MREMRGAVLALIRLWREGRRDQEIAEALDLARSSIAPYVRDLRDAGVELAYRRPRGRSELLARRRRAAEVAQRGVRLGSSFSDAPATIWRKRCVLSSCWL